MRQAVFDTGWLLAEDGTLQGLCLGYDRCAEHEWGIQTLERLLGVPQPEFRIGPADRLIHRPEFLKLHEYSVKPRDKRRKAYPAVLLTGVASHSFYGTQTVQELVSSCQVSFFSEPGSKWHEPRYDLAAAWGERDFAVQVRGAENIERLRAIAAAAERGDLALTNSGSGWLDRHAICLVILSSLSEAEVQAVTERDEAHRELILAARATGIEEVLKAAGKKWFALSPGWRDKRKQHVDFFLNPHDQQLYDFGWFTVDELRQWARDEGPVLLDKDLREFESTQEGFELVQQILNQLKQHGIRTRNNPKLAWMDADKTVKGIFLHVYYEDEAKLADGTYAIDELLQRFPVKTAEAVQG